MFGLLRLGVLILVLVVVRVRQALFVALRALLATLVEERLRDLVQRLLVAFEFSISFQFFAALALAVF